MVDVLFGNENYLNGCDCDTEGCNCDTDCNNFSSCSCDDHSPFDSCNTYSCSSNTDD